MKNILIFCLILSSLFAQNKLEKQCKANDALYCSVSELIHYYGKGDILNGLRKANSHARELLGSYYGSYSNRTFDPNDPSDQSAKKLQDLRRDIDQLKLQEMKNEYQNNLNILNRKKQENADARSLAKMKYALGLVRSQEGSTSDFLYGAINALQARDSSIASLNAQTDHLQSMEDKLAAEVRKREYFKNKELNYALEDNLQLFGGPFSKKQSTDWLDRLKNSGYNFVKSTAALPIVNSESLYNWAKENSEELNVREQSMEDLRTDLSLHSSSKFNQLKDIANASLNTALDSGASIAMGLIGGLAGVILFGGPFSKKQSTDVADR